MQQSGVEGRVEEVFHLRLDDCDVRRPTARPPTDDRGSWELLQNWPILEKDTLRENPRAFVADDCDVRRMFREQTSGTTGKPLILWRSHRTLQELYALSGARTRLWHGVTRDDRWAMLGGQLVVPVDAA